MRVISDHKPSSPVMIVWKTMPAAVATVEDVGPVMRIGLVKPPYSAATFALSFSPAASGWLDQHRAMNQPRFVRRRGHGPKK